MAQRRFSKSPTPKPVPLFIFKMVEKIKKESHQEKKTARQKTIDQCHNNIKNAQGRKAKKSARKNLRKFLKK